MKRVILITYVSIVLDNYKQPRQEKIYYYHYEYCTGIYRNNKVIIIKVSAFPTDFYLSIHG